MCLAYHSTFNGTKGNKLRSWTLLTDNDEYILYNYPHNNTETIKYDHPSYKKKKVQKTIDYNRKKYMHWRYNTNNNANNNNNTGGNENNNINNNNNNTLPMKLNQTIFDFIKQNNNILQLPTCVRIPGIHYGGGQIDAAVSYKTLQSTSSSQSSSSQSSSSTTLSWLTSSLTSSSSSDNNNNTDIFDPNILSTYRYIYHEKRKSKFSKVMIDVSRLNTNSSTDVFDWSKKNHAKTIHNPSKVCGYNGPFDSGADYYSSIFRLNHYIGSIESFLERQGDYRSRSIELYNYKFNKIINITKYPEYYDYDILPWIDLFIQKCNNNITKVKQLLFQPLFNYTTNATTSTTSGTGTSTYR
jgi:hypothetical protein